MSATIPSVCFVTLGCAKNEVDSARMTRRVKAAGFALVSDPSLADAVVVNTCSFIQAATEESIEAIFDVAGLPNVKLGGAKLIVAGCMPARYGQDLAEELPEAQLFVPCSREDDIVEILSGQFEGFKINPDYKICDPSKIASEDLSLIASELTQPELGPHSAYVKISDGCNRFCSFCTIPHIRGRYRSFPYEDIAASIEEEIAYGAKEIVLIAQDTGRWGDDFEEPSSLAWLMDRLAKDHPNIWFRVMYIQPEGITDELLEVIAAHKNVCSYLDIPFQHCDKALLKAMNRRGDKDSYLKLAAHIRDMVPEVSLRTTLIAGFPGETEEQFEALCDFVEELDFDYVGVFPYSQEEGTRAARLDGQIDQETKEERAQIIRDIADSISVAKVAQRQGKRFDVLVLAQEEDGALYGRAQCQAPDVDGVTYVGIGKPGEFVSVEIADTLMYEMESVE